MAKNKKIKQAGNAYQTEFAEENAATNPSANNNRGNKQTNQSNR